MHPPTVTVYDGPMSQNDTSAVSLPEPLHEERTTRSAFVLGEFVRNPDGRVDLEAPYQRGSIWTLEQRQKLIESVLRGVPIAALVLSDMGPISEVQYRVIDGKQRLESLIGFTQNKFAVPGHWFPAENLEQGELSRHRDVQWDDLSVRGKIAYRGRSLAVESLEHEPYTSDVDMLAAEERLYLLINTGGTAHTEADLNRAR